MKKNIAIVAGGNSSEVHVSLRSAAGIKSFIDAEKYNCFIVTIVGKVWQVELSESERQSARLDSDRLFHFLIRIFPKSWWKSKESDATGTFRCSDKCPELNNRRNKPRRFAAAWKNFQAKS